MHSCTMEKTRSRSKSQKWCHGGFKRGREMLVSVWSKICLIFLLSVFIVPSTSPEIVSLSPHLLFSPSFNEECIFHLRIRFGMSGTNRVHPAEICYKMMDGPKWGPRALYRMWLEVLFLNVHWSLGSQLASNCSSGAQVQGLIPASCSTHSPKSFRPIPLALWSWLFVLSPSTAGCTNWLPVISLLLPVCSDEWMVSFKLPSVTQVVYAIQPASWKQLVSFRFASSFFLLYPIKVTETIAQLRAAQCSFSGTHRCVYLSCYVLTSQLWYKR